MIALKSISDMEERRLALSISEVALESTPLEGGGTACRDDPGNWANTAVGLRGPMTDESILAMIAFHESAGVEPRVELSPYADRSLPEQLSRHGYRLRIFENVFFVSLDDDRCIELESNVAGETGLASSVAGGIEIVEIDRNDAVSRRAFAETVALGFAAIGTRPPERYIALCERCVIHPRSRSFAAAVRTGSRLKFVGGGSMETLVSHNSVAEDEPSASTGLATLYGASVLPEFRHRGIQRTLMLARLRAARGTCSVATISARPGVSTESNARRLGFQLAYTKAILTRPGPGLVGVD